MADLDITQASKMVSITGSSSTGVEQTPVQSTSQGGLHANLRDASGNELVSKQIGTQVTSTDVGLVTNSVLHAWSTAGGGAFVDVKANPSGSLMTSASVADGSGNNVTSHSAGASRGLDVSIIDGSGNQITSFGGGTQYTEDAAAAADPVGTVPILVRADTPAAVTTTNGDNVAQRGTNYGAAYVQVVNSSGTLIDTFGGSGGTAAADKAAFTYGTTSNTPVGGVYQDTSPSLTAGQEGAVRLTANRAFHTNLRDVNGNPVSVAQVSTDYHLEVMQSSTDFYLSAAGQNSSTTNLAAAATFFGSIEDVFAQQNYSILFKADQPVTLNIKQYIDAAGTYKVVDNQFTIPANTGWARSGVMNGNYLQVTVTNTGASTTTSLNLNTAYGTIAPSTALNNLPVSLQEIDGTALSYTTGIPTFLQAPTRATYAAVAQSTTLAATPTDVFTIYGSATKTVKVQRIIMSGTQTTAAARDIIINLRSTANTGGTSASMGARPLDSTYAAGTATTLTYTANPTALGTSVGSIYSAKLLIPTSTGQPSVLDLNLAQTFGSPVVLRGTAQGLCVNFNSVTSTGGAVSCVFIWTEE